MIVVCIIVFWKDGNRDDNVGCSLANFLCMSHNIRDAALFEWISTDCRKATIWNGLANDMGGLGAVAFVIHRWVLAFDYQIETMG